MSISGTGKEMDKSITMTSDFILDSFGFIGKNLDKILMVTIIVFLAMAWTIVFEWKIPEKKNIIFQKTIKIEAMKTKDQLLSEKLQKDKSELGLDCGTDELCKKNQYCLSIIDNMKCSLEKDCCQIKKEGTITCVGGSKEGPTYNDNMDEWWYLGNFIKQN
tara:strand:- start:548 stop:1030 length:483 start_codon:yes stop_codon:yes gene_type:complete